MKYISPTGVVFEVVNHFELTGFYECKTSYNPKGDGMVMITEKFFKTLKKEDE